MAAEALEQALTPSAHAIRVASSRLEATLDDLLPEERAYVERSVASRQAEFAAGRVLARQLLVEIGCGAPAILRDADRVPLWPEGVIGSISHTEGACLVALSRDASLRGVGVDVEGCSDRSARFLERIATPAERAAIAARTPVADWPSRIFSAKEAVYKACFPRLREFWGFQQVEIDFEDTGDRFAARVPASAGGRVLGELRASRGRIWTLAYWLAA